MLKEEKQDRVGRREHTSSELDAPSVALSLRGCECQLVHP